MGCLGPQGLGDHGQQRTGPERLQQERVVGREHGGERVAHAGEHCRRRRDHRPQAEDPGDLAPRCAHARRRRHGFGQIAPGDGGDQSRVRSLRVQGQAEDDGLGHGIHGGTHCDGQAAARNLGFGRLGDALAAALAILRTPARQPGIGRAERGRADQQRRDTGPRAVAGDFGGEFDGRCGEQESGTERHGARNGTMRQRRVHAQQRAGHDARRRDGTPENRDRQGNGGNEGHGEQPEGAMPVCVAIVLAARAAPGMDDTEARASLRDNTKPLVRPIHAIAHS